MKRFVLLIFVFSCLFFSFVAEARYRAPIDPYNRMSTHQRIVARTAAIFENAKDRLTEFRRKIRERFNRVHLIKHKPDKRIVDLDLERKKRSIARLAARKNHRRARARRLLMKRRLKARAKRSLNQRAANQKAKDTFKRTSKNKALKAQKKWKRWTPGY